MNREEWLGRCIDELRPLFATADYAVPDNIRVSCSWPSKQGLAKKRRIGEAWSAKSSDDNTFEVFISPVLKDPVEVAAVLIHELAHCTVGVEHKHKGPFKKCVVAVGLEGKPTATYAGEELKKDLEERVAHLGSYPHAELKHSSGPKKQTTRLLKVKCTQCECIVRMTRTWLDQIGPPTCGCGAKMAEDVPSDGEKDDSAD